MCALSNVFNYSFKWITCLVVAVGSYTFLHWFLATPLLYFHLHDCCDEKWPKNQFMWIFLAACFVTWLLVFVCFISVWCCLGRCIHLNRPTGKFIDEESQTKPTKESNFEGDKELLEKDPKKKDKKCAAILNLPDLNAKGSFTILQMNDVQRDRNSVSDGDFPIPVNQHRHYIQGKPQEEAEETCADIKKIKDSESSNDNQTNGDVPTDKTLTKAADTPLKSPPKTPREIFFRDLMEAASNSPNSSSYFDFDPKIMSEEILKKFEAEKSEKSGEEEKTFFVGAEEKENVTSEVYIALNEKGVIVDEPLVLGKFQVLKE